ncbi:hypothetical protein SAMN05444166_1958 [Singulisphaera sp. GP187]|uniref:hypothetical protein n=1 Tax=Singulisphaera sp. GP187 TaxID=1882752 RepID=UPI00092590B5|nr:hypothetical protein [Singulisphaera sp. GP187]SIN99548.1 hypothetical protein SAMN05444166_1958 [Singulisphaera sp. GP187]
MRPCLILFLILASLGWNPHHATADEAKRPRSEAAGKSNSQEKSKSSFSQAERETIALGFVKEHHPELASLLEQLKAMRPEEYRRAIAELFQVSQSLETLKKNNPPQYEVGLEFWKAKSKAELLAARLISAPSPELESQLRRALENQLDLEIRKQELLEEQLKARLSQIEKTVKRLKDNRDRQIDNRLLELQKKVRRARSQDGGESAPAKPVRAKKESEA